MLTPASIISTSHHWQLTVITPKDAPLTGTRRTTRSGKETSKPRNADIPDGMRELWQKLFVPLARELIGTLPPWASLDIEQVRAIYKRTWPKSTYIVQKGDVFWNLVRIFIRLFCKSNPHTPNIVMTWADQLPYNRLAFIDRLRGYRRS